MVKITISDLAPDSDGKSINELTIWEMKTVYAGLERRYSARRSRVSEQSEEPTATTLDDTNTTLERWMDTLDLQLQDLRRQLGIRQ